MPEYLYPGVYVEEVSTGNKPIEGVSTSTVGFLGIAERGPLKATLITSFTDFTSTFGRYVNEGVVDRYLAYAVEGFFQNGGKRCFVMRVASRTAKSAKLTVDGKMDVQALGPGIWGGNIVVQTTAPGIKGNGNLFSLIVAYWSAGAPNPAPDLTNIPPNDPAPTLVENFDNLSAIAASSTFYVSQVNNVSSLITLAQRAQGVPAVMATATPLEPGDDGGRIEAADFEGDDSDPTNATGLAGLGDVDEISIICCPDEFYFGDGDKQVTNLLVQQCQNLKDRFAILQAPQNAGKPLDNNPSLNSNYAAYYYPWLQIINPDTGVGLLVPPGGHIAGIYSRSDTSRGVQKDPANEVILGINQLQLQINNQQQAILNPKGVNCLRHFKGLGNLVWGGRTTASDPDWKYISVRRLFIFIEKSIERGTQWVVFEPNDETLWATARRSVSDFLTGLWMNGMLQGATREQAFFVRCDRTTMTQADLDNGRFIMLIGVAPVKPAEFVIFRIGQWTGGSDVTEG
jgi:phage tail sheath protein FI